MLNFCAKMFALCEGEDTKRRGSHVCWSFLVSGYVTVRREGLSVAPATPPECVNEKERGQEESTTEVLTEGNGGLRLHLFWPSTLPAGPRRGISLLLASVMGAGASASSGARRTSSSLAGERQETLEAPSAEGSPRSLRPAWGKAVRRAYAAKARGSRSG